MLWLIAAETRDSDVNCPDPNCGERMSKTDYPLHPWPREVPNAEMMTPYLGKAFCYSCGKGPHAWYMMS